MKYQKALLCIALAGTLIFSGCGSTNNSTDTDNTTSTSSSVESTVEASTEDTDTKSDENAIMGMISEITDSTITVATMPGGGQGEAPGNPPDDNNGGDNGSAPADKPDSITTIRAKHRAIRRVTTMAVTITLLRLTNQTLMAQILPKPLTISQVATTLLPLPTTAAHRIWAICQPRRSI